MVILRMFLAAMGHKLWPIVRPFFKKNKPLSLCLFFLFIFLLVLSFFISGCSTARLNEQEIDVGKYYRRSLKFWVTPLVARTEMSEDEKYECWRNWHECKNRKDFTERETIEFLGVGVVRVRAPSYRVRVKGRGDLDYIEVRTCHRDFPKDDEGKYYRFKYRPNPGIEDHGSCLLRVKGFSKSGRHSFGILDFKTPFEKVRGINRCNGEQRQGSVMICQSRAGLVQQLVFSKPMKVNAEGRCDVMKSRLNGTVWEYKIPKRECVYAFCRKSDPKKCARLTTIGYEGNLIPSE